MNPESIFFIITILILIYIPCNFSQDNQQYQTCRRPFQCGNIRDISYPFYGGDRSVSCGYPGFDLTCQNNSALLYMSSIPYQVLEINNSIQSLRVSRRDLLSNSCPTFLYNTTLDFRLYDFSSSYNDQNITLYYGCVNNGPQPPLPPGRQTTPGNQFNCSVNQTDTLSFFVTEAARSVSVTTANCVNNVLVPVSESEVSALGDLQTTSLTVLQRALSTGFWIDWLANNSNCNRCVVSGGVCGSNPGSSSFACYCSDRLYNLTCNDAPGPNGNGDGNGQNRLGINIGLAIGGAVLAGIGVGWLIFHLKQRRKKKKLLLAAKSSQTVSKEVTPSLSSKDLSTPSTTFENKSTALSFTSSSQTEFGRDTSTYFGVQVFNYAELEEATDNFNSSRELGDGGFGTVYYGVLRDGRIVAVKRLYENNFKRVEQFMNEVEILTRLNHQYLVKLYGCTSKRSRELLLVYEYISNGTIADHLHGKRAKSHLLSWPIRLNIAIETADALSYLHKSDIIHRDVKSNNILLDNDFHVKVADFGLSRLFPTDVTHVSTAPQGTPGYVDPEYYQCYQLTEKSDVYSFGVVLIELISSLQAVDTNRHRHDINLANMAINKIQNHALGEIVDKSLGFETDSVVTKMITLVMALAFRCLQHERDLRPCMDEVVEGLREIKNEDFNAHKVEIVDVLVDENVELTKGSIETPSPDSIISVIGSTPNSVG